MFAMTLLFQCRELLQRQLPTCDSGALDALQRSAL